MQDNVKDHATDERFIKVCDSIPEAHFSQKSIVHWWVWQHYIIFTTKTGELLHCIWFSSIIIAGFISKLNLCFLFCHIFTIQTLCQFKALIAKWNFVNSKQSWHRRRLSVCMLLFFLWQRSKLSNLCPLCSSQFNNDWYEPFFNVQCLRISNLW